MKLVIVSLIGCAACKQLISLMNVIIQTKESQIPIIIEFLDVSSPEDLKRRSLNIKLFPTLLAYKNNKLRLGWEGFAALAPDEIKREMVEDVLRQVAALADEDDCGGASLHEMPQ